MYRLLKSVISSALIWVLRRRQFDSKRLRGYFKKHYAIDVGLYSYGCFDQWRMPGPMRVGRYCSIAGSVRSALLNHPLAALSTHSAFYERRFGVVGQDLERGRPLVIEDDVWIGHNAVILPGCKHIGRGAIIGAGSIVTRDVPAYAIVAGNPARTLRARFEPELVTAIEASRWWTLDLPELAELARHLPELISHPTVAMLEAWEDAPGRRQP